MMKYSGGAFLANLIRNADHHHAVAVVQMPFVPIKVSSVRTDVLYVTQNARPEAVFSSGKIHPMLTRNSAEGLDDVIGKSV